MSLLYQYLAPRAEDLLSLHGTPTCIERAWPCHLHEGGANLIAHPGNTMFPKHTTLEPGPYGPISRDLDLSKNNLTTHSHYLHGMDAILIINPCSSESRRFCEKCCLCQLIIVADVCPALGALTTYCSPSIFSAQWWAVRALIIPCRTALVRLNTGRDTCMFASSSRKCHTEISIQSIKFCIVEVTMNISCAINMFLENKTKKVVHLR